MTFSFNWEGGEVLHFHRTEAKPQQTEEEVVSGKGPFGISWKARCRSNHRFNRRGSTGYAVTDGTVGNRRATLTMP